MCTHEQMLFRLLNAEGVHPTKRKVGAVLWEFLYKLIHNSIPDESLVEKECCLEMDK